MCDRRLARRLHCLILLYYLIPGCQVFHGDQSLIVLVRDAETKKPISTAEVYLCQRLKGEEIAPCRLREFTQADGIARLRTEPLGEYGIQVQAVAQGYLPETQNVSADLANGRRQPAGKNDQPAEQRPSDLILEVYAEPNFSVEFVLPPGYRGLIKAEIQIPDNQPLTPGQRCFRFPVSASGEVLVKGPSVLQRVAPPEFRARYGDGPVLATTMDVEKIGFRWLKGSGSYHYFVVGNQLDYEALHRRLAPEETRAANGSPDATPSRVRPHKYQYGKMTAKDYE
jgi:hypothetical protein